MASKPNIYPDTNNIFIRDAVDIETNIVDSSFDENKTSLTDSEQVIYSTIDLRHSHLKVFSLLSTSDKEINLRLYPDQHVEDMAKNHSWTTPYAKPLQTNHDVFVDCNARFIDSWYLKHNDLVPKYGYGKLPQNVIDEFQKRGAFNEGTGSTIGMAETANLDFKRKIIDGTYLTTSQGARTNSLTCNICENDYRNFSLCRHSRGTFYPVLSEDGKTVIEMRRCVPYTGPLDAVEDSVVNVPANETSTLLVYDTKKNKVITMDNVNEYSDIFNLVKDENDKKPNVNDVSNNKATVTTKDSKPFAEPGLTDEQIKFIQSMIDKNIHPTIEEVKNVGKTKIDTNKNTNDNKEQDMKKGGKAMAYQVKNSAIKRIFKDDMRRINVTDSDKIGEFFDSLIDMKIEEDTTALDIAMSVLDFISDNLTEVQEPVTTTVTTTATTDDKNIDPNAQTVTDKNQNTAITDSQEFKDLQDNYNKALKLIADLKGLDNSVPDLAKLLNEQKDKEKTNRINDFGF